MSYKRKCVLKHVIYSIRVVKLTRQYYTLRLTHIDIKLHLHLVCRVYNINANNTGACVPLLSPPPTHKLMAARFHVFWHSNCVWNVEIQRCVCIACVRRGPLNYEPVALTLIVQEVQWSECLRHGRNNCAVNLSGIKCLQTFCLIAISEQ